MIAAVSLRRGGGGNRADRERFGYRLERGLGDRDAAHCGARFTDLVGNARRLPKGIGRTAFARTPVLPETTPVVSVLVKA